MKQEENLQHLCIRVDVEARKSGQASSCILQPHLSLLWSCQRALLSYSREFHTIVTLVFIFVEGWPLFLKTTN